MSEDRYIEVLAKIEADWPDFEVLPKEGSILMKAADIALKIITFGKMKEFMTRFVTTMGNKVYVPTGWDDRDDTSKAVTMRHEAVHIRQKGRRWYGGIVFGLKYLLWPLPAVWARGRRDIEQEAYAESMQALADYGRLDVIISDEYREHIIGQFMSANYFWTWPWRESLENWYDGIVEEIIRVKKAN